MILIVLPDVPFEQALLARARAGDALAQRTIYEQYFTPIYTFIRLRVNDRDAAQDIAAEVFLDFFIALQGKTAPRLSLRAWLFRVARFKLIDHYGSHQLAPIAIQEWLPDAPEREPDAIFMRTAQTDALRRALQTLNSEQQEVLLLRFGQGLSLGETSDLMGKSISAIKSLQFRAVDALRKRLQADDSEEWAG